MIDWVKTAGKLPPTNNDFSSDQLIGKIIGGKYKILEFIDKGAQGNVFKASEEALDRTVAIKLPNSTLATGYKKEAKLLARRQSPNLIQIFDIWL